MTLFSGKVFTRDLVPKKYRNNIGEFSYGRIRIEAWEEKTKLKIGKFCSFAKGVTILLGGEHRTDWVTTYPFPPLSKYWNQAKDIKGHPGTKGDVIIGNDVWIGNDATILSGVTIGDGAVVGAKSLVTKNVPPYTIVAGNPAKIIRKRFDDKTIKTLLTIKWWNWSTEKINNNVHNLCNKNIKKFIIKSRC